MNNPGCAVESAGGWRSLTQLLSEHSPNDREVLDQVIPLVYGELHNLARRQLSGNRNLTLNTTALVDEAYLKMVDQENAPLDSRAIFFGAAARAMRQVLVDAARRRNRLKRGGDRFRVTLNEEGISADGFAVEILELNDALERLEEHYPRQAQVVECRFFGGMSTEETAQALSLSRRTVVRDWTMARAWLFREMNRPEPPNNG